MVPRESTAEGISFEWSHHRISSTDSKVRTTLIVCITDSGSERVKIPYIKLMCVFHKCNAVSDNEKLVKTIA